jgi:hypothetical protein
MKPDVLSIDRAGLERRILHQRRGRMRYRIAENSETNRRIDISRRVPPIL